MGGAERVAVTLANAWAEQGREVWILSSFLGASGAFYKLHARVSLLYLADSMSRRPRQKWFAALYKIRALRRLIVQINPDVTVSVLTNVNVLTITALATLRIPLVVSERTDPAADVDLPRSLRVARVLSYPFADRLVVQTAAAAGRYAERLRGVSRIAVIPNPVPGALMASQVRARHDGSEGTVVAMGRLSAEKGYAKLIKAFGKAFASDASWRLEIWGNGPLRAELQGGIDALGMTGRIRLCGPTEEPWVVLAAAQIFVLTSQYEGFPNAMLEAMAVGLPCIAFDCPSGPRELSDEGRAAIIVPRNDVNALAQALTDLSTNPDARRQVGARAAAYVRRELSESTILAKWDELFGQIRKHRARTPESGLLR
jgi:GalNAc-alpha-(1->4)-GalNAc-alpha-(1->3)-diNAcBac-PP-undecaprenol alpha-1,4-N-acetyl-D-galactosaminyltransferase